MSRSCGYLYKEIFDNFMQDLRFIFLGGYANTAYGNNIPCGDVPQSYRNEFAEPPYPIFDQPIGNSSIAGILDYINYQKDAGNDTYAGFVVWNTHQYYYGNLIKDMDQNEINPIGFFVVPEYGEMVMNFPTYLQIATVSFDSFTDFDPHGVKLMTLVDWFISQHKELSYQENRMTIGLDTQNDAPTQSTGGDVRIWTKLGNISKPIYNEKYGTYSRRTITLEVRYCSC